MARIDGPANRTPNALAGANTGNRKVLYEEVEQVTALRTALDSQYRGARRPGLPAIFARAFATAGQSILELPAPPLPADFTRRPEPRQVQLELRNLVHRHRNQTGSQTGGAANSSGAEADRLLNLLERMSKHYAHLENRVAAAQRS